MRARSLALCVLLGAPLLGTALHEPALSQELREAPPYLGVAVVDRPLPQRGVLVVALDPEGPAYEAGLRVGDVIVTFDGWVVREPEDLAVLVTRYPVGAVIPLFLERDGDPWVVPVALGEPRPLPPELVVLDPEGIEVF